MDQTGAAVIEASLAYWESPRPFGAEYAAWDAAAKAYREAHPPEAKRIDTHPAWALKDRDDIWRYLTGLKNRIEKLEQCSK